MTNIIDKLEADGLVRRVPHAEDRRATLAEITDEGRATAKAATEVLNAECFGIASLPPRDLERLTTHPSRTAARRGRLHPVASGPPQIRGLPTISTPMAASTPTVPTTEAEWREAYALGRERDVPFTTLSGLPIKPLYTEADLPDAGEIGMPGGYPFTRGVYPSMYRGRLWTMRQFAGFGTAEETNERFRYLLDHGQTGLSTAFDMPSLMGHDSDHARSLGEVGREGVAIDTLDDMQTLFAGIPLGDVSVSMTINAPAAIMLAFYVVAAEAPGRAGRPPRRDDPGRHPQGVHRPEGVVLPDRPGDAPAGRHDRVVPRATCRAGIRSRSRATTSARPARRRRRSWPSRSRTA